MTNQVFDVVALGELLIDFTDSGLSPQGNLLFEANPGGAPCNVLAMLKKLGKSCAFIGKIGNDIFGDVLRHVVEHAGINIDALATSEDICTTLAIVRNYSNGDRDFSFYRNPGADMALTEEEVPDEMIENSRIFHFGTLSLTHEVVRNATVKAVNCAKSSGVLISFDPNLRLPLWSSQDSAKEQIAYGFSQCDILKIADNELKFMTGEEDFDKGISILKAQYPNIRLINVTAGAEGSYSYYNGMRIFAPGFQLGGTIETTGAGDAFCASVLNFVLENGLLQLTEFDLTQMLRFANAAAYLVTTKKGGICSMPDRAQIETILRHLFRES